MKFYTSICLILSSAVAMTFGADDSAAQLGRMGKIHHQPVHRVGRFLGNGYSAGYHHCNPGPDVGYYNPYSAHNSYLVSQSPEYLAQYGNHDRRVWMRQHGGQFSQAGYMNGAGYGQALPGVTVDAEFEPAERDADDGREEADASEDNDFTPDDNDPADDDSSDGFDSDDDSGELGGFSDLRDSTDDSVLDRAKDSDVEDAGGLPDSGADGGGFDKLPEADGDDQTLYANPGLFAPRG